MQNKIYYVTNTELTEIKQQLNSMKDVWIAEIDGKSITCWKDYALAIEKAMNFPTSCDNSIDVYLDFIRDLEWLNKEGYVIIINHFTDFFSEDSNSKNIIINSFEEAVLPWWQNEVKDFVVGGKSKCFSVYFVD